MSWNLDRVQARVQLVNFLLSKMNFLTWTRIKMANFCLKKKFSTRSSSRPQRSIFSNFLNLKKKKIIRYFIALSFVYILYCMLFFYRNLKIFILIKKIRKIRSLQPGTLIEGWGGQFFWDLDLRPQGFTVKYEKKNLKQTNKNKNDTFCFCKTFAKSWRKKYNLL